MVDDQGLELEDGKEDQVASEWSGRFIRWLVLIKAITTAML